MASDDDASASLHLHRRRHGQQCRRRDRHSWRRTCSGGASHGRRAPAPASMASAAACGTPPTPTGGGAVPTSPPLWASSGAQTKKGPAEPGRPSHLQAPSSPSSCAGGINQS